MLRNMTLQEKIGQLLIVGFNGYEYNQELKTLIEDYKVGNVILFARNIKDLPQLVALSRKIHREIKKHTGITPFIAIDQEGGMVTRIKTGATFCPGNMTVAATNDTGNAYKIGAIMGDELIHLGINLNLAPTLDVNNNPANPVIGVRSYGDNPDIVSRYGVKFIKGIQEKGVIATAKHFPGHGDTNVDSHLGLPMICKDIKELMTVELPPFASAIKAGVGAIMSAHIVFPKIDTEGKPATLSKKILTDLLKNKMGFSGLIISDCMLMKAIDNIYTAEKGAVMGLDAGLDMICVSRDLKRQISILNEIYESLNNGTLNIEDINKKAEKIISSKAKTEEKLNLEFIDLTDNEILGYFKNLNNKNIAMKIVNHSLTLLKGDIFQQKGKTLVIATSPYARTMVEEEDKEDIASVLKEFVKGIDVLKFNLQTDTADLCFPAVNGYDQVVFCSYNVGNYPEELKLINKINNTDAELYVISLRNPYDYMYLPDVKNIACLYEYTNNSIFTLVRYLSGIIGPKGKFPVEAKGKLKVSASLYVGMDDYSLSNNLKYLKLLKKNGIDSVFISAHMPEAGKNFDAEFKEILNECEKLDIKTVVDLSKKRFLELKAEGMLKKATVLRLDYGFTDEDMLVMMKEGYQIELNASSVKEEVIKKFIAAGIDVSKIRLSHNFYPKKYTGLSLEYVKERNDVFKKYGCHLIVFIPSHKQRRGPLYDGLPTIEAHRTASLTEILTEAKMLGCDEVCFGDAYCGEEEIRYARSFDYAIKQIPVTLCKDVAETTLKKMRQLMQCRIDAGMYLIRSTKRCKGIEPFNTVKRYRKDITIDNDLFKRYAGEITIVKKDLEADERVNVIGRCACDDYLLDHILPGDKFRFVLDEKIMQPAIIAIDGGGTKTKAALIDIDKKVIYTYLAGPGSPAVDPAALDTVKDCIKQVYDLYFDKYAIKAIVMGISGLFTVENREEYAKSIESKFNTPVILESDALVALYSIIQDKYDEGLLVLAGTGTAIMGIKQGKAFLASGWGQLLTERGSAYACVKDYVCQMIDEYERNGFITPFGKKLMKNLGYDNLQEFKKLFYRNSKKDVAQSSKFFYEEALKGDIEAQKWLYYNGTLLAKDSLAAIRHLHLNRKLILGFRGGFASNVSYVQEGVIDTLKANKIEPVIVAGDMEPIFGAFYLAKKKGYL